MKPLYQRFIILSIWVIVLGEATRQGWSVPKAFPVRPDAPWQRLGDWESLKPFNWNIVWFGLFAPPVAMLVHRFLGFLFPFLRRRRTKRFSLWVDRRWGQGTMALLTGRLHSKALMATAALILGSSAVLACEQEKSSPMAFHAAMFLLGAGVGISVTYLLEQYLDKPPL